MAPKPSVRSLRVRSVEKQISVADLDSFTSRLLDHSPDDQFSPKILKSISADGRNCVCTITFPSEKVKKKAQSSWKRMNKEMPPYIVDDIFDGVTILHTSEQPSLEYVRRSFAWVDYSNAAQYRSNRVQILHGLGGNSMDTFQATTLIWLRDLLPTSEPFSNARIMTFGYNSVLFETRSDDRLQDWADYLLDALELIRSGNSDSHRPIVFVCHSLGGLVARKAMIRLTESKGRKYKYISLSSCALLFLSTPHSGTTEADYNEFLTDILARLAGLRKTAIVAELQRFNKSNVDATESFKYMDTQPSFSCLCESSRTKVGGQYRLVVPQASAGFLGQTAAKVPETDHHTVCKFDTKLDRGYQAILKCLKELMTQLLVGETNQTENRPGHPDIAAYRTPLPTGKMWYLGSWLKQTSGSFTGRQELLSSLSGAVGDGAAKTQQNMIALTGTGGIGKTETMLEFALSNRNHRHVFFCRAESLELTLGNIATTIGSQILEFRYERLSDRETIWRHLPPADRVAALIEWLGHESNRSALCMIDDTDALRDGVDRFVALSHKAHNIVYTGRNPHMLERFELEGTSMAVKELSNSELVLLMQRKLQQGNILAPVNSIPISGEMFTAIAVFLKGHTLAACRAVQFMIQILSLQEKSNPGEKFLTMFTNNNWELRKAFVEFDPRPGRSILDVFRASFDCVLGAMPNASRILCIAAFLSNDDLDFRSFLQRNRPWANKLKAHLPSLDLFTLDQATFLQCLGALERTSLLSRRPGTASLVIHPIWRECLFHRVRHPGRIHILRQIYLLAHASILVEEDGDDVKPYLDNALAIAQAFRITEEDIRYPHDAEVVLQTLKKDTGVSAIMQKMLQKCQAIKATLPHHLGAATSEAGCNYTAQIIPVLQEFSAFEKNHKWHQCDPQTMELYIELYDSLITITRGNPMLSEKLTERKSRLNAFISSRKRNIEWG